MIHMLCEDAFLEKRNEKKEEVSKCSLLQLWLALRGLKLMQLVLFERVFTLQYYLTGLSLPGDDYNN